jgi:predicted transcriptional regulator
MALTEKATVLFSEPLFGRLKQLAAARHVSVGALVREACIEQYHLTSREDALAAVEAMAALSLPVGEVAQMKAESVPPVEGLPA